MAGVGDAISDSRTFKLSMKEYEDIGIKVGDTATIEITKSENMEIKLHVSYDQMHWFECWRNTLVRLSILASAQRLGV